MPTKWDNPRHFCIYRNTGFSNVICRVSNSMKITFNFDFIPDNQIATKSVSCVIFHKCLIIIAGVEVKQISFQFEFRRNPDSKVHGAYMGPTWVLSAPDGPRVGPVNLAIRERSLVRWAPDWYLRHAISMPVGMHHLCYTPDFTTSSPHLLLKVSHLFSITSAWWWIQFLTR